VPEFEHQRHKPPLPLARPRELVVACAAMRSNVNLSHIVRTAGCFAVERVICCGAARLIDRIARDGAESVRIEVHRTLLPVLRELERQGAEKNLVNSAALVQQAQHEFECVRRFLEKHVLSRTGLASPR
jgi:16S rRNA A1518/A1519 N6-dimethyltransferase RsmA/KsgA/DIM1 with predicted DNA glycosylase/AP lyase activity